MADAFKIVSDGLVIRCRVTPSSSRDEILSAEKDASGTAHLKLKVSCPPEKGKANKAAIKLLAKSLGLPKTSFEVISGHTSRLKTLKIFGDGKVLLAKAKRLV